MGLIQETIREETASSLEDSIPAEEDASGGWCVTIQIRAMSDNTVISAPNIPTRIAAGSLTSTSKAYIPNMLAVVSATPAGPAIRISAPTNPPSAPTAVPEEKTSHSAPMLIRTAPDTAAKTPNHTALGASDWDRPLPLVLIPITPLMEQVYPISAFHWYGIPRR